MRRSKIVIGVFLGVILIVLTIILLACTVFIVRDVKVESSVLSPFLDETQIIESSGLTIGRSIISIDKNKIAASIEKANPFVEVLDIVREFPSKVVVKVGVRTGVMSIGSSDGVYAAIVDSSAKVLKIVSATDALLLDSTTRVEGTCFVLVEGSPTATVGTFVSFTDEECGNMLKRIAEAAKDPKLNLSGSAFNTHFKKITFERKDESLRALVETHTGVVFVLDSALSADEFTQLYMCMQTYWRAESDADRSTGYILSRDSEAWNWCESLDE